ncbi:MAG TPA: D-alanine--D-alanine ligase [Kiloniellaceae bacterium]|nr:D-alanine--D-alanine ligase [Kiloniellaceae bacterium]
MNCGAIARKPKRAVKRVLVLMGGQSAEREVSLASGRACAKALRDAGYDVESFDLTDDTLALVQALQYKPDVVFNALHGHWGEDGCIQGLLELLRLPYTHSGVMASSLAMNKQMAKQIAATVGITSPKGVVVDLGTLRRGDIMPRPYVVKPVSEGSSVGVQIVKAGDNRPPVWFEDWAFGQKVLVEEYIPGRELTVAVMGDRPLTVTEICPKIAFYDYEAKYTDGRAEHILPADIPEVITQQAKTAALAAHRALGCRGVSRSDFRYDETDGSPGRLVYLETNTQPGMTALSLVPEQAAHLGISFPELCSWMVEQARCDS